MDRKTKLDLFHLLQPLRLFSVCPYVGVTQFVAFYTNSC